MVILLAISYAWFLWDFLLGFLSDFLWWYFYYWRYYYDSDGDISDAILIRWMIFLLIEDFLILMQFLLEKIFLIFGSLTDISSVIIDLYFWDSYIDVILIWWYSYWIRRYFYCSFIEVYISFHCSFLIVSLEICWIDMAAMASERHSAMAFASYRSLSEPQISHRQQINRILSFLSFS